MIRRIASTLMLVLAALLVLAWPLSRLGVACSLERNGARQSVGITQGLIVCRSEPVNLKLLERDRYWISTAGWGKYPAWDWKFYSKSGPATEVRVPIVLPLAALALGMIVVAGIPWIRGRRRKGRRQCLKCGYPRPEGDAVCPECGTSPVALEQGAGGGKLLRDTGIGVFGAVLGLCVGAWMVVRADERSQDRQRAEAFDYSWYLEHCEPRVNGDVLVAAPGVGGVGGSRRVGGAGPPTLEALLGQVRPGTTIVLLPGVHALGSGIVGRRGGTPLRDIWLLGFGADTTTLTGQLGAATRVRIEGVSIDCKDDECVYFDSGGSVALRGCRVSNFNSGAGGSNAVFASGAGILVEGCEFEGKSGRASAPGRFGNAFDLRGDNHIYLRDSRFVDISELFRNADSVLDGCTVAVASPGTFWPPMGGSRYLRNTALPGPGSGRIPVAMPITGATTFVQSIDDAAVLDQFAKRRSAAVWTDAVARGVAEAEDLARRPEFWKRLLVHPSAEVRRIAREQIGASAPLPGTLTFEEAMGKWNGPRLAKDAALAVLGGGEDARTKLREITANGTATEQDRAKALLLLMDAQPTLPEMVGTSK